MRNPFTRFESPLKKFGRSKKKPNNTHILSHIEIRSFHKRKKRVIFGFLRKLDIKISKEHSLYYVWILVFTILTGIWVWVFGPYLEISRIEIIRDSSYIDINMSYNSVDSIRRKKIYNLDTDKLVDNLIHFQNNIEWVKLDIIFPNRLDIHLHSSEWLFYTHLWENTYVITKNGTFVPSSDIQNLEHIYIYNNIQKPWDFVDYKKVLSEEYLQKIEIILSKIRENMLHVQIESLHYFVTEREVLVETQKWFYIILSLQEEAEPQVEKLVIFDKENGRITEKPYIYIDARVTNKIFLCDIENEFDCRKNLKNLYGEIQRKQESNLQKKEVPF